MIDQLKRANLDNYDLEQLIELSAIARLIRNEFEVNTTGAEAPKWLDDRTREVRRAIATKQEDILEARLNELKSRRSTLRTAEEKRSELDAEIAKVEAARAGKAGA
jgi:DNA repair exonuclease SbcCD ATPase subunit